jgi:hypothetical protein
MFDTKITIQYSMSRRCGHSALSREGYTMFQLIQDNLDYRHADSSGRDTGYCVEYQVTFHSPDWSIGQWFNVTGVTADGSLIDLLSIGYSYQYTWLVAGTYTNK